MKKFTKSIYTLQLTNLLESNGFYVNVVAVDVLNRSIRMISVYSFGKQRNFDFRELPLCALT